LAFPRDLLELAYYLVVYEEEHARQANLRRAVSTAYYAVFHLLIEQAMSNWAVERQRSRLARTFEYRSMKSVCEKLLEKAKSDARVPAELRTVARTFIELQHDREIADYDNSKDWSVDEAFESLDLASGAFAAWAEIGVSDEAEDFLLQLFLPKLPAQ
jgi:uncharacterized protein (UPF0332 family)